MKLCLPYGPSAIEVTLPDRAVVREPDVLPPHPDPAALARRCLDAPLGMASLEQRARGRTRACIAIPDATRPAVCGTLLAEVVARLRASGIVHSEIVIATGTHRAANAAEVARLLGPSVPETIPVRSHDAFAGAHVHTGTLASGVEVWIDRGWVEADLRIAFGVVEPHLLAGYSGGAKTVCPGLARLDTIRGMHRAALARGRVGPGIVAANPFRAEIESALELSSADFAVQSVAAGDGSLARAYAGRMQDVVRDAVRRVDSSAWIGVDRPFDVVVTTAGGWPLDRTLYQAAKGWLAALAAVRPGGDLILLAEMRDGIGSPDFEALLRRVRDPVACAKQLSDPALFQRDQWMLQHVFQARARARLHLVTGLPRLDLAELGFDAHASLEVALESTAPASSLLVLPRGPFGVVRQRDSLVTLEGELVPSGRS